ncbi:hypothetical protein N784_15590 [Pontibacillus litoralis JSM 072002]|uniref:Uncharacterized protein n=1 Tax=Pontibacillus litoralis JSM 072002 TaxID=1385512 RepID=A0A0A5G8E7_9BACI|nr:hypothetical protein N784_15590 [Pontibacillus litoralis JSM 072002]
MLSSFGVPGLIITVMAITGLVFLLKRIFKKNNQSVIDQKE